MKLRVGLFVLLAFVLAACGTDIADELGAIEVSPETATIDVGDTATFTADAADVLGDPDETVTWTVEDDDAAAEVVTLAVDEEDPNSVTVTGVTPGTATLTATSNFDEELVDTATITVTGDDVTPGDPTVEVTPETATLTLGGEDNSVALTATVEGTDEGSVTWSSADEAVATVSDDGIVTAAGVGETTVTATLTVGEDTFTDSAAITVVASDAEDTEPAFIGYGSSYGDGAYPIYDDTVVAAGGSVAVDLDAAGGETPHTFSVITDATVRQEIIAASEGTLDSEDDFDDAFPSGVTLDPSTGEITGTTVNTDAGFYRVVVQVADVDGDTDIGVVELEVVGVESVVVEPESATITAGGGTETFTATVSVQGSVADSVTWSIADESVATITSGAGTNTVTVTGGTAGTTTLTATSTEDSAFSDTVNITVE